MDLAVIGAKIPEGPKGKLQDLDESEEIAPALSRLRWTWTESWRTGSSCSKNETTTIPKLGPLVARAACLGGAIRDPLSGRSYVYQAMRVTGAGPSGPCLRNHGGQTSPEKSWW